MSVARWCLAVWCLASGASAGTQTDRGAALKGDSSWWLATYGTATLGPARQRLVEEVFARVSAAAALSGGRARLLLVGGPERPMAHALSDRTVVLNRPLIEECWSFAGEPAAVRSVLAFVMAHELAHLSTDDPRSFAAFGDDAALRSQGAEERRRIESAADVRGMLIALAAGFDPQPVVAGGSGGLFARVLHDRDDAVARSGVLDRQLAELAWRVEEYRFGIRLLELGRLEDARLLLGRFRTIFAGREVLNDLAVTLLRQASRELSGCDGRLVVRYRLPTVVDGRTVAERRRLRGPERSPCLEAPAVNQLVDEALELLDEAIRRDATYLPAYLNRASAELLAGRFAEAVGSANKAVELDGERVEARVLSAIALHGFGRESGMPTTTDTALEALALAEASRPSALVSYNRAAIEGESGRAAAAAASWRRVIELEPASQWAGIARERLGLEQVERRGSAAAPPPPPIRIGPKPPGLTGRSVVIGTFRGEIASRGSARALVIRDAVELVESPPPPGLKLGQLLSLLGPPERVEQTAYATLSLWDGLLAETVDDRLVALVWSAEAPPTGD